MIKTVFWSWQSDRLSAVTKDFIKLALSQALKKVAAELELETAQRFELDHDTKGEAGLVEIVATIFRKIDECEVFVADITPVAVTVSNAVEKMIPNPNVMIELGYALRELGHQRIITVANLAFGGRPEDLPFDLRHRRGAITYSLENADDPSLEKKRKALVEQLAGALRINLEAPREDRMIKNPLPALSLEASDKMSEVALIQQNSTLEGIPSLADIKAKTPVKSKASQTKSESSPQFSVFEFIQPIGIGSRQERVKSFIEWTQEELEGYNKRVQQYHDRYATYLEAAKEHRLLLQRTIVVELVVVNSGTRPATDVRSSISFPPEILIYEHDDLPKPPAPPSPPPFAPHGVSNATVVHSSHSHFGSFLDKSHRIADDHRSIDVQLSKLQHGYSKTFSSFTLLLASKHDIKSFDADYYITADELPLTKKGKLRFEVKQSDS